MGDPVSPLVHLLPVFMGVVGYMALHHLWLWLGHRREPVHLWAAAWCANSLLYLLSHSLLGSSSGAAWGLLGGRIGWTSAIGLPVLAVGLSHALGARRVPRRVMIPLVVINLALLVLLWTTNLIVTDRVSLRTDLLGFQYAAPVAGPLLLALVPYIGAVLTYSFWTLRAAPLPAAERRLLMGGGIVCAALGLNDVLHAARIIQSVRVFPFALVATGLGLSYMAVQRQSRLDSRLEEEVAARTRELSERRERLATLSALTEGLTETLRVDAVLDRVARRAVELFGASVSRLWLVDDGGQTLSLRAHAGAVTADLGVTRLGGGEGLIGWIVDHGAPLLVEDVGEDPRTRNLEGLRAEGVSSVAGVPLVIGERVLGALAIAVRERRRFGEEDLSLLQSLANHAAIALENARLYAAEQAHSRELAALQEVQTALVSRREIQSVLDAIADWAGRLIGAQGSAVFDFDPREELLHPRAMRGLASALPRVPLRIGQGGPGAAVLARAPVSSADVRSAPLPGYGDVLPGQGRTMGEMVREFPYRALLAVPIISHGEVRGAITVVWAEVHAVDERETRLLTALGQQAAIALDNARLNEALEGRLARLETLTRLNRLISSSLDTATVLREIGRAAAQLMNVPCTSFWTADEAAQTLSLVGLSDPDLERDFTVRTFAFDDGALGWIASHRRALNIPDVYADDRFVVFDWWRTHGFRSFYGVPVVHESALLAVLALNGRQPFHFGPEEERLLESFVAQAAVAMRNALLYEAEGAARHEAELALAQVKQLHGMLPICAYCKKIRNDRNYWESIETYLGERSQATFSHGICPECQQTVVAAQMEEFRRSLGGA